MTGGPDGGLVTAAMAGTVTSARPTARAASEVGRGARSDIGYLVGSRKAADGSARDVRVVGTRSLAMSTSSTEVSVQRLLDLR